MAVQWLWHQCGSAVAMAPVWQGSCFGNSCHAQQNGNHILGSGCSSCRHRIASAGSDLEQTGDRGKHCNNQLVGAAIEAALQHNQAMQRQWQRPLPTADRRKFLEANKDNKLKRQSTSCKGLAVIRIQFARSVLGLHTMRLPVVQVALFLLQQYMPFGTRCRWLIAVFCRRFATGSIIIAVIVILFIGFIAVSS